MALCLAESLIERGTFDPGDQMRRHVRWWREGHWSSTGRCFDIGDTVRAALQRFGQNGEAFSGVEREFLETRERSLLYVAATRARRHVIVTSFGQASPFLGGSEGTGTWGPTRDCRRVGLR